MNPTPPPPRSESADFAPEHQRPTSPNTPSPDGPLEGLDPDGTGWGARDRPPRWDQFKAWVRRVTRPSP